MQLVVLNRPYPLFKSSEILDIISTAKLFKKSPSDILGIDEDEIYTRYCIDEACTLLYNMVQPDKDGKTKEPIFDDKREYAKQHNEGLELLMGR